MHHTVAWRLSSANITLVDQTPVPDELFLIQNGHFVPQTDWSVLYAYVGAATLDRARFVAPTFRQVTTPWIRPIGTAIVPLDEPNVADYRGNPLKIRALEEWALEAQQSSGGAAVIAATAGITRTGMGPVPSGDIYTMRGTGTTTVTAGAWTQAIITWQDTLPAGTYVVVGLEAVSVTGIAARLIFEEQWERPGTICQSLTTGNGSVIFRKGGLGAWGRFNANRMPSIQFLCNAADTAQEVFLEFIRVA